MPPDDNQSQTAARAEVDNSMRTDVLGPAVMRVMRDHAPLKEHMKEVLISWIKSDPDIHTEVKVVVRAIDREGWIVNINKFWSVIVGLVIILVTAVVTHYVDKLLP